MYCDLREKARTDALPNFAEADVAAAAKKGTLQDLVDEVFGPSDSTREAEQPTIVAVEDVSSEQSD